MRTEHIQQLVKTAESCVETGSIHKATAYFHRVVELSKPGEFTAELALVRLSDLYQSQMRYRDAIGCIREAIAIRPSELRYTLTLAELYFSVQSYEQSSSLAYDAAQDVLLRRDALDLLYRIACATSDSSAPHLARLLD